MYWAEKSSFSDSAVRMPIGGGTPQQFRSMGSFSNIVADASNAYFTSGSSCTYPAGTTSNGSGVVISTPKDIASSQPNPTAVAIDSSYIYWVDGGPFVCHWPNTNTWYFDHWSTNGAGTVKRAPLAGGTIQTLAYNVNVVYFSFYQPAWIAVNARYVYWTDDEGLHGRALNGGTDPSFTAVTTASIVALDANNVYWSNPTDGTILQMPAQGGTVTTLASGQTPLGVTSDGFAVYWVNMGTSANSYADGAVKKAPIGGGAATTIATVSHASGYLVVDATSVYWTVEGTSSTTADGAVWKASK